MLVQVTYALLLMCDWETVHGLGVWLKHTLGTIPPWMVAAEAQAKGSYETACEEYVKALDVISHVVDTGDIAQKAINAPIVEFIVNQVRGLCIVPECTYVYQHHLHLSRMPLGSESAQWLLICTPQEV